MREKPVQSVGEGGDWRTEEIIKIKKKYNCFVLCDIMFLNVNVNLLSFAYPLVSNFYIVTQSHSYILYFKYFKI